MTIVTILFYGIDKIYSLEKPTKRIPEIVLISLSTMGGVLGSILATIFFNHKSNMSRKWHFFFVIIVSAIVQLVIIPFLLVM